MPSGLLIPASMQQGALKGGQLFDGSLVDDPITALGPHSDWYANRLNLNDEDLIGLWPDPINGNDFTQSTTPNKPVFDTDSPVYSKAVRFDNVSQFMEAPHDAVWATPPYTMFFDIYLDAIPSVAGINSPILEAKNVASPTLPWTIVVSAVDDKAVFTIRNTLDASFGVRSNNAMTVGRIKFTVKLLADKSMSMCLGGVVQTDTETVTGTLAPSDDGLILCSTRGETQIYDGWVNRPVFFDKELTDDQCIEITS